MSQYIPDMTERFPEGRNGIDMTDSFFGGGSYCPRDDYEEDDYCQEDFEKRSGYADTYYFVWADINAYGNGKWYLYLSEPTTEKLDNLHKYGYCSYTIKTIFDNGEEIIEEEDYNNGYDIGSALDACWDFSHMTVRP